MLFDLENKVEILTSDFRWKMSQLSLTSNQNKQNVFPKNQTNTTIKTPVIQLHAIILLLYSVTFLLLSMYKYIHLGDNGTSRSKIPML